MNQPTAVRRNRQAVYIGEHLRKLLALLPSATLSTVVNMLAERYAGLVERTKLPPMMDFHAALYCNVLREMPSPLNTGQIAAFPAYVKDWLAQHPEFPQEPGKTAVNILARCSHLELLVLVDHMEKQL